MNHAVLIAQSMVHGKTDWLELLMQPSTIALLVPITAIVGGIALVITQKVIRHRERMAMIEQGIDPDRRER